MRKLCMFNMISIDEHVFMIKPVDYWTDEIFLRGYAKI